MNSALSHSETMTFEHIYAYVLHDRLHAYMPSDIDLGYEDGSEKLRTVRARSNNAGYARESAFTRAERHFYARELNSVKWPM